MKYVYPAVFYKAVEGGYFIDFPDVEGAFTQAENLYEALEMAEDALNGMLMTYEDFKAGHLNIPMKNRIVAPTPIYKVVAEPNEYSTGAFVTLIKADTDAYRKLLAENKSKKSDSKTDFEMGAA